MNKTKLMMAISIAWILSACAKGQMTEEQTQKTVAEGQKVIIASNDYFNSLIALQIQSASIIYATHPECNFNAEGKYLPPKNLSSNLCSSEKNSGVDYKNLPSFLPLSQSDFAVDQAALKSFSEYLNALSAYTSNDDSALKDLLDAAKTDSDAAKKLAEQAHLDASQVSALKDMADFMLTLAQQHANGEDIGELVKARGPQQSQNLESLRTHVIQLKDNYVAAMNQTSINAMVRYYNNPAIRKKNFTDFDKSSEFAGRVLNMKNSLNIIKENKTSTEIAIDSFVKCNNELLAIINNTGLTPEQKSRKNEIARANLRRAVNDITQIVKPLAKAALL
ncbi:MAG: hypothetical protein LBE26_04755 [Yokenella regensburgei]|jgi:hypothetical protein|nr:hypothetical protein [Yokenella regensburgei]